MQTPTCTNLRIRSPADVRVVFHAVLLDILPMVTRRLDSEERGLILPGSVYVWEERGSNSDITGVGIERWTDGIRWGPSRVREGFLFYHEKPTTHYVFPGGLYPSHRQHANHELLIKQTYTAFVDTPRGQRKWHLIAYFTEESIDRLNCIENYPALSTLRVPHGKYKSARSVKGRPDHIFNPDDSTEELSSPSTTQIQYVVYKPNAISSSRSTPSPPRSLPWNDGPTPPVHPRAIGISSQHHTRNRSLPGSRIASPIPGENGFLAPLEYLQTVTPPRRHPMDETTLKLFKAGP
ncbi:cAMP-independent regulatory protein pac2 [Mycena indigotica]|uniref:cAMP-independent regulatory protein pac2 n=1 Tax=Mycena indigotica TaxID=2126181 RepID=A0A8H6WFL9_9AGAR|nr:cAMP-independent regulatory protein pac2 [Mycena indigotica]KAF7315902.1 cAMP-independent regulatory protein pac2 [Mycena indigotica]